MEKEFGDLKNEFEQGGYWGLDTNIDLYDCDPELIRNAEKIKQFIIELCELANFKRFGECIVVDFGSNEKVTGFSMTQLIDTSLISGHFVNKTNNVFLDIFSCKFYDPKKAAEFAKQFFQAKHYKLNYQIRK